jgi:TIR domain
MSEPERTGSVFISYRREDSAGYAGRIYDHLGARFGNERVFMDCATIQCGEDFVKVIGDKVGSCAVLVAVIGKTWLTSTDGHGHLRLNDPRDFVRLEILQALQRNIPVVPVLIGNAAMPRLEELPEALVPLGRHQAFELSDARFQRDMASLIEALERIAGPMLKTGGPSGTQLKEIQLAGQWTAEACKEGSQPFKIYLTFDVIGDKLLGSVSYPTGNAGILEGKIEGDTLSFLTRHVPRFCTEEATIHWYGKISGEEIRGFSQDQDSQAKFTAKRSTDHRRYGWTP